MPRWRKEKEEEPKRLLDNSIFMHALMERMYKERKRNKIDLVIFHIFASRLTKKNADEN
jgi:hypothetical protein